jgi:hypothetical protein
MKSEKENDMKFTRHAIQRSSSRGLTFDVLNIVYCYGHYLKKGKDVIGLTKKDKRMALQLLDSERKNLLSKLSPGSKNLYILNNLNKDINEINKKLDEINNDIKILKSLKDNIIYCAVVINDIVITTYKKGA